MKAGPLLCLGLCVTALAAAQAPRSPTVEELMQKHPQLKEAKREMDAQRPLAEHECTKKLDADDPTVEWKKSDTTWKDEKWVVTRYGTRNMAMVTGVCQVTMDGRKVKAIRTWVK